MQYDVDTPQSYLQALENDWRKEQLIAIRSLILNADPSLSETIQYKMLAYLDEKGTVFQLNAQKGYVALYVGNAQKVDPSGQMLVGLDVGKGCIRFKKSNSVEDSQIAKFIREALRLRKSGGDIDC